MRKAQEKAAAEAKETRADESYENYDSSKPSSNSQGVSWVLFAWMWSRGSCHFFVVVAGLLIGVLCLVAQAKAAAEAKEAWGENAWKCGEKVQGLPEDYLSACPHSSGVRGQPMPKSTFCECSFLQSVKVLYPVVFVWCGRHKKKLQQKRRRLKLTRVMKTTTVQSHHQIIKGFPEYCLLRCGAEVVATALL